MTNDFRRLIEEYGENDEVKTKQRTNVQDLLKAGKYKLYVIVDDERLYLSRSVATVHDHRIHVQLNTRNESELQRLLDQVSVWDWFDCGMYKGDDEYGMGVELFTGSQ